jgi:hypothetical protein
MRWQPITLTRPTLAHLMHVLEVSHGLSLGSGRRRFVGRSFGTCQPRCTFAKSFFSLVVSMNV